MTSQLATFTAASGRDAGKRFRIRDIDPLTLAGFALRLLSALRIPDWSTLQMIAKPADAQDDADSDDTINAILGLLRGCDPDAVHKLITEALTYVEIAPDPKHPEAWRPLMPTDIEELRTLGTVLMTFAQSHLSLGE